MPYSVGLRLLHAKPATFSNPDCRAALSLIATQHSDAAKADRQGERASWGCDNPMLSSKSGIDGKIAHSQTRICGFRPWRAGPVQRRTNATPPVILADRSVLVTQDAPVL